MNVRLSPISKLLALLVIYSSSSGSWAFSLLKRPATRAPAVCYSSLSLSLQPTSIVYSTTTQLRATSNFLEQQEGESSAQYMKRLSQLAADPQALERQVQQEQQQSNSTTTATDDDTDTDTDSPPKKKKTGYVRAEEWDAQRNAAIQAQMQKDAKLQFDGLRHGNGVQQNEILRHHLNGYK